jgi:catechol 2,3-dioxygenase-like lactoylglutathione lyase family enzyme
MIERIDHVNLVVEDMPGMIRFYRDVLGLKLSREATIRGAWIDEVTGLNAVEADVAFMELPSGPTIELLRYRSPQGTRPGGLGTSNVLGLRHFAFRVHDIDRLVERAKEAGVVFLSGIQQASAAQVDFADKRKRLIYFHDPEGNLLEFCAFE